MPQGLTWCSLKMADVDLHLQIGEIKERFEKLMIQFQAVILYKI